MPAPSYITTWLSLLMLRLSMAAANWGSAGSMWGREVAVSATLSMSKYCAPGILALRNSAAPSLPAGAGGWLLKGPLHALCQCTCTDMSRCRCMCCCAGCCWEAKGRLGRLVSLVGW